MSDCGHDYVCSVPGDVSFDLPREKMTYEVIL